MITIHSAFLNGHENLHDVSCLDIFLLTLIREALDQILKCEGIQAPTMSRHISELLELANNPLLSEEVSVSAASHCSLLR